MGYNTRRKSLSLPSLGIHLPGAARSMARSPPSTTDTPHTAKKVKRTHAHSTSSAPSPSRSLALRLDAPRPKSAGRPADTPPPSPAAESAHTKVDTRGIDDDIVVGVIDQLEKTGNRPHLLKELALVLSPTIPIVERYPPACLPSMAPRHAPPITHADMPPHSSANPAAIISSRLATYLKRNWTALARCPLDKQLVGSHPKRIYYFLTTCPHQPIPADAANPNAVPRIITPCLSSAASEEEDVDPRARHGMSPSPELDLSDYDENSVHVFTSQSHPPTTANIANNRRAQSPPLEKDEREFTQTASFLQQRRRSQELERERWARASASVPPAPTSHVPMDDVHMSIEETEESAAQKNSEIAVALFGQMDPATAFAPTSSPALKPVLHMDMPPPSLKRPALELDLEDLDWAMKSPETIELDELDVLFSQY
ncbi:hypothetical protein ACEQ8H_004569 [Pleosporales sp. CAS-2024a]